MQLNTFTGSSGVGKTTLLERIKFDYRIVELSGRPYLPSETDFVNSSNDSIQRRISYGSLVSFTEMMLSYGGNDVKDIFFSRCAIDRLAYSRIMNVGMDIEDILLMEIKKIVIPYMNVFYIPVEFPLPEKDKENDKVRGFDEAVRSAVDKEIKNILVSMEVPFKTVSGTIKQRLAQLK